MKKKIVLFFAALAIVAIPVTCFATAFLGTSGPKAAFQALLLLFIGGAIAFAIVPPLLAKVFKAWPSRLSEA